MWRAGLTCAPARASGTDSEHRRLQRALTAKAGAACDPLDPPPTGPHQGSDAALGSPDGALLEWSPEHAAHPCNPAAAPLWLRVPWHMQPLMRSYDDLLDTLARFSLDLAELAVPQAPGSRSTCSNPAVSERSAGLSVSAGRTITPLSQHTVCSASPQCTGERTDTPISQPVAAGACVGGGVERGGRPVSSAAEAGGDVPEGLQAVQDRRNWVRSDVHDPCMVVTVAEVAPVAGAGSEAAATHDCAKAEQRLVHRSGDGVSQPSASTASSAASPDGAASPSGDRAEGVHAAGAEAAEKPSFRILASGKPARAAGAGATASTAKVVVFRKSHKAAAAAVELPKRQPPSAALGGADGRLAAPGHGTGGWGEDRPQADGREASGGGGGQLQRSGDRGCAGVRRGRTRQRLLPPPPKEMPVVIDVPAFDSVLGFTEGFYDEASQTMYIM